MQRRDDQNEKTGYAKVCSQGYPKQKPSFSSRPGKAVLTCSHCYCKVLRDPLSWEHLNSALMHIGGNGDWRKSHVVGDLLDLPLRGVDGVVLCLNDPNVSIARLPSHSHPSHFRLFVPCHSTRVSLPPLTPFPRYLAPGNQNSMYRPILALPALLCSQCICLFGEQDLFLFRNGSIVSSFPSPRPCWEGGSTL